MGRIWWIKVSLILGLIVLSALYVIPSFLPSWISSETFPSWGRFFIPKNRVRLGLDLQGGLHIVMGIDPKKVLTEYADFVMEDIREGLKKEVSPAIEVVRESQSTNILVKYSSADDIKKLRKEIRKYQFFEIVDQSENQLTLGFSKQEANFLIKRALEQSIEAIRNRIDEFGVSEPSIQSEGLDRLIVQLPGIQDPERAKELIGRTAKLEFKIVDTSKSPLEVSSIVAKIEEQKNIKFIPGKGKFSEYVSAINRAAEASISKGSEIVFEKKIDPQTQAASWVPYLLIRKVDVSGEFVRDARMNQDSQTNEYIVELTFTAQGGRRFADLTEQNVKKQLAIVLDGMVHSAPVISEKIPSGRARITFGRSDDPSQILKDAQDTALVLRAGSLPTTIELLEERTVGPSLGADSVSKGKKASVIGLLAVILFMLLYYRISGGIANVALLLNLLFMMAVLAIFDATLTLPGIAGIALTIGMAVDANVLIFERIREELRLNRSPKAAIEAGFLKAWGTIFDSNLTTLIAALALLSEGTGPVKGFAVTLSIGICCSMFTAVFVTRVIFEFLLEKINPAKVSI